MSNEVITSSNPSFANNPFIANNKNAKKSSHSNQNNKLNVSSPKNKKSKDNDNEYALIRAKTTQISKHHHKNNNIKPSLAHSNSIKRKNSKANSPNSPNSPNIQSRKKSNVNSNDNNDQDTDKNKDKDNFNLNDNNENKEANKESNNNNNNNNEQDDKKNEEEQKNSDEEKFDDENPQYLNSKMSRKSFGGGFNIDQNGMVSKIDKNNNNNNENNEKENEQDKKLQDLNIQMPTLTNAQINTSFGKPIEKLDSLMIQGYKNKIPKVLIELKRRLYNLDGLKQKFIFHPTMNQSSTMQYHIIATLIRTWFAELPIPLLDKIDKKIIDSASNMKLIPNAIEKMPEPNCSLLLWLWDLLADVLSYSKINKMTSQHLAQSFGPIMVNINMNDIKGNKASLNALYASRLIIFFKRGIEWRLSQRQQLKPE